MSTELKIPKNPFEKIALSLSGGGYRAAAFHLGSMAYLYHLKYKGKPLLENVKMLSTVSGGTITGAVYALKKSKGDSFPDIYRFILKKLNEMDLIKEGFELLQSGSDWQNTNKRKNLINAFSMLYDKYLTESKTIKELKIKETHLDAVVFNSTEFNQGLNFRFRTKGSGQFGNNYFRVNHNVGQEVKIADAIAASSCFPGGFEPISWPNDFIHSNSPNLQEYSKNHAEVGLMDGGIYDNQGIDSILMYKKTKKTNTPYFDLIIVSDVSSPYMKGFEFKKDFNKPTFLSNTYISLTKKFKKSILLINIFLIFVLIGTLTIPFLWNYENSIGSGIFITISILFALLLILINFSGIFIRIVCTLIKLCFSFPKNDNSIFEILKKTNLRDISLRRMITLLGDRISSINILLNDVFLKVVRRHQYKLLYNDDNYTFRRITSLIKELTENDFNNKNKGTRDDGDIVEEATNHSILKGSYDQIVGDKIKELVEETSNFGTTLWFSENEKTSQILEKLIATGEVTMCYNMLEYLNSIIKTSGNGYNQLDQSTKLELSVMYEQCLEDWNEFKKNPFALSMKENVTCFSSNI